MSYQVLSRRYRPKHFKDVIGQESIVTILTNAISSGKIPHAFLFTGIRGTGKTTTARIFARAINCREGVKVEPCDSCDACEELLEGRSIDVMEIDGASNTSVNDVRMLKENTRFLPAHLRYKVYIIDEVHMLSNEAFNALLKTLEEPPDYVIFILATTEPQKIPETVLSRCIRLNFKRVAPGEITKYLAFVLTNEHIEFEESALFLIARQSEGSVRDSMSFLELVLAYGDGKVTEKDVVRVLGLLSKQTIYDMLTSLATKNITEMLNLINKIKDEGGDIFSFVEKIIYYMRHLVLHALNIPFAPQEFSKDEIETLTAISKSFIKEELIIYYQGLTKLLEELRFSPYPLYDFEVGLLKLILLKDFLENSPCLIETDKAKSISRNIITPTEKEDKNPIEQVEDTLTIINKALKNKPAWKACLENTEIKIVDKTVEITFPARQKFFYEHFSEDESRKKQVEKVVKSAIGTDYNVKFKILQDDNNNSQNGSIKEQVSNNPSVKLILSSFEGAKILDVKEIEIIKKTLHEEEIRETEEQREESDE